MTYPLDGYRLVIADDHALVRMGFRLLLESAGATIIAEVESGEAVPIVFADHRPDVLVMDVSMPGIGGLGALERLLAHHPSARVLILSALVDTQIPMRALTIGAAGYLSKHAHPAEFIRAVGVVGRGRRYIDPTLSADIALAMIDGSGNPVSSLTVREFEVFQLVAKGVSVNEIARIHRLSPSTVGAHLYHIKQKLHAENGAALALIAVRAGVIEVN